MNITDVDDKIILRARQQHFLAQFRAKHPAIDSDLLSTTLTAFNAYIKKNLPLVPEGTTTDTFATASSKAYQTVKDGGSLAGDGTPPGDKEAKIKMHLRTTEGAASTICQANSNPNSVNAETFYSATEDVLLPYLDSLYGTSIDPYDHTIFTSLTKKYEELFFEDMRSLNVLDPDQLTRVTEFGPQIVEFVKKIVAKRFAYPTSDGSVYFDISGFEKAGNPYARLEPWNRGDKDLQADGEGALTKKTTEKKSDSDFAVWKGSKSGEPAWKSPWGGKCLFVVLQFEPWMLIV
jgi:cysteinyl-tRNA synthetase